MSLALDASHDLYLGSRSGIAIAKEADEIVQGIETRLSLFLGEWFLDTTKGVPWFEEIFVDNHDIRRIERLLKEQIEDPPGVEKITQFQISTDAVNRSATITFEVDTIFGPSGAIGVSV